LFTSPLNALAGDTRFVVRFLITPLMIFSPVFYPIAQLEKSGFASYMWYSPLACILELYRWGMFHQHEPVWWHIWLSLAVISAIFVLGLCFFSLMEQRSLEEV
jgi:ABC-type polysaccharide/polyol phosphate export permease